MDIKVFNELNDDIVYIRTEVFMKEQGFDNEFDDLDYQSVFVVVYDGDVACGTGRCYRVDKGFVIGRVAVLKEYRNQGIGKIILSSLEDEIRKMGSFYVELSAQQRVQVFYEKLGYTRVGDVYFDEHCAHVKMIKEW